MAKDNPYSTLVIFSSEHDFLELNSWILDFREFKELYDKVTPDQFNRIMWSIAKIEDVNSPWQASTRESNVAKAMDLYFSGKEIDYEVRFRKYIQAYNSHILTSDEVLYKSILLSAEASYRKMATNAINSPEEAREYTKEAKSLKDLIESILKLRDQMQVDFTNFVKKNGGALSPRELRLLRHKVEADGI